MTEPSIPQFRHRVLKQVNSKEEKETIISQTDSQSFQALEEEVAEMEKDELAVPSFEAETRAYQALV
jgi:hypothetical protein